MSTSDETAQAPSVATGTLVPPPSSEAKSPSNKVEPLEIMDDEEEEIESLLPTSPASKNKKKHAKMQKVTEEYFNGFLKPQKVGNMTILFPELYFEDPNASWGVMGPQPLGPLMVWLLLCLCTHLIVQRSMTIGLLTTLATYGFYCYCTYRLVDVAFRDPGICFYQEIPETVDGEEARQWRWCDFCNIFQPPDGAHCTQCDVCVEGYDHYCLWMG